MLLGLAGFTVLAAGPAREDFPTSDLERVAAGDRILVIAPHPDDETLCCAGVMQRALAAGARVAVVWLTSGDAFELDADLFEHTLRPGPSGLQALGARRMGEARSAARRIGVPTRDQLFLGFPDRGLLPLLLDHYYIPYTSPYTGLSSVSYAGTLVPGARYLGEVLVGQLEQVLEELKPTYVLAPTPLDTHPDHRAAGDLVIRVLGAQSRLGIVRYWVVHGGRGWPTPRGLHTDRGLEPPRHTLGMQWQSVVLTAAQRQGKLEALQAYHTQMFGLERRYLESFVRSDELFAERALPDALAAPDPHGPAAGH